MEMTYSIFSFVAIVSNKTKNLENINLIFALILINLKIIISNSCKNENSFNYSVRYSFNSEDYIKMHDCITKWYRLCTHIHKKIQ